MPVTLKHVPIVSVGEWPVGRSDGGTGTQVTREKLDRAVLNAASGKYPRPVIGLGHGEDRKANGHNGTPALGGLANLTVEPNEDGVDTLYADLTAVPEWAPERYPRRSAEWWETTDGEMVIHRLALLGDEYPAVDTLDDLEAIVSDDGPALLAAGAVLASGAAHTLAPLGADQPSPQGPEHNEQEDPVMELDPKLVARSLGLPEDTPVDKINEALASASETAVAEAEQVTETEAVVETEQPTIEAPAVEVAAAADDGVVKVDAAAFQALQADAQAGREAREQQVEERRMTLITAGADEGKYLKDRIPHFVALHKADPEGTEALIASLAPGVAAPVGGMVGHSVTASASQGEITTEEYRAWKRANTNGATA